MLGKTRWASCFVCVLLLNKITKMFQVLFLMQNNVILTVTNTKMSVNQRNLLMCSDNEPSYHPLLRSPSKKSLWKNWNLSWNAVATRKPWDIGRVHQTALRTPSFRNTLIHEVARQRTPKDQREAQVIRISICASMVTIIKLVGV